MDAEKEEKGGFGPCDGMSQDRREGVRMTGERKGRLCVSREGVWAK